MKKSDPLQELARALKAISLLAEEPVEKAASCCSSCSSHDHGEEIEKATTINWKLEKNFRPVRKLYFQGLDVSIEHDTGMVRKWKDESGETGETVMKHPYGYICRTEGEDDEQIDAFIGPDPDSDKVYIVHQLKAPKFERYDEDKVILGTHSAEEAKELYLSHYNDPRFFGRITQTSIQDFKRMFVNKSDYSNLWKTVHTEYLEKGLTERLGRFWDKIKAVFQKDEKKPTKMWVRNTNDECKTGVCLRLDGQTVDIDGTFTAMNGMQVDGPPAHTFCKCGLYFDVEKSLNGAMPIMPMMPMLDPQDVETFEGVQSLLGRMGGIKDPELMEIAEKIWGDGCNFEGQSPQQARAEIMGFLMDQRDLLGVMPVEMQLQQEQPSLSSQDGAPPSSLDSSNPSESSEEMASPEDNSSDEEYQSERSTYLSTLDYLKNSGKAPSEDTE